MKPWRSALFVPGDAPERIAKAPTRGADAVILDLEDGVAQSSKRTARDAIAGNIAMLSKAGQDVVVRINGGWRDALADLEASVQDGLSAIMVPKAEDPARLSVLVEVVAEIASAKRLAAFIPLVALVESPRGLANADAIAAVDGLCALALGTEDFALTLGVAPSTTALALPARQIALAAAARGIMGLAMPISIASMDVENGWRAAAEESRAVGATGALCIHPSQVAMVNSVFAPTAAELGDAESVVEAWRAGDGERKGVIAMGRRMIDRPVVERARRMLASQRDASNRLIA